MPFNIDEFFNNLANQRKAALDTGLAGNLQQMYSQIPGLNQQYDAAGSSILTNARLSALGGNEGLASMGLAGAAAGSPTSGYSESSRIAQDTAMGNALNANQQNRLNALNGIGTQASQAGMQSQADWLNAQAQIGSDKASALQTQEQQLQQQAQFEAQQKAAADAAALAQQNREADQATDQQRYEAEQADAARQEARARAENELQMFGKVITQEAADALGVPIGTTMYGYQAAGGSGSGSRGLTDEAIVNDFLPTTPTSARVTTGGVGTPAYNAPTGNTNAFGLANTVQVAKPAKKPVKYVPTKAKPGTGKKTNNPQDYQQQMRR